MFVKALVCFGAMVFIFERSAFGKDFDMPRESNYGNSCPILNMSA